jgi:hypothetical protein
MGCDIHSYAEKKNAQGKWEVIPDFEPFECRNYAVFGWLADVRNYSGLIPISMPRDIPKDASAEVADIFEEWDCDAHTPSWLSVEELLNFDYDATCEDLRYTKQTGPNSWNGGATCEPGEGKKTTYRELFGEYFFNDLEELKKSGAERVIFWFDN